MASVPSFARSSNASASKSCPRTGAASTDDCAALVVSTAVEEKVPDFAAARAQDIPIVHRSELLAHFVASYRTMAVSGTSGKSTVTAMIFEILDGAGRDPSVITGGDLRLLQAQGLPGNAFAGGSDLLVVEADESDGSLVRYAPAVGVILNLQRDHKEMAEVAAMFAVLRARSREALVVGEDENLDALAGGALRFGFGPRADIRGTRMSSLAPQAAASRVEDVALRAAGARPAQRRQCACRDRRLSRASMCRLPIWSRRLRASRASGGAFRPWARRAASPSSTISPTTPTRSPPRSPRRSSTRSRVLAVYQPHGYGPTRFLRRDFVDTFSRELGTDDRLWMLEVFYAGGTASRDFSAADIVAEIAERGVKAEFAPSRAWLAARIAEEARAGDLVLVMGARRARRGTERTPP